MRLDFVDFSITGPSTGAVSVGFANWGNLVNRPPGPNTAHEVSLDSRCMTDIFSVSNPGGPSPPSICGINTDNHSKTFNKN